MKEAERLKELLGERAKDIIANGIGLVENSQKKVLCPLHSEKTPSMSWYSQGLVWKCHACDGTIDIYKYFIDYEHLEFVESMKKVADLVGATAQFESMNRIKKTMYAIPKIETQELSEAAIAYMAERKISKETLNGFKVEQRSWKDQLVYVFNYLDEHNKLRFVSYRGIGKNTTKGGCEQNTEPILWGMWQINKEQPVVITEGQLDAMSVYESGYHNVVSVPNGANNLKWIESCWDFIKGLKEIIVFADNDKPGLAFAENIKARLKNVKVVYSDTCKDANEILCKEGAHVVLELIITAIKRTPEGIIDIAMREYHQNIKDTIETGFIEYDEHVNDLKTQELTIICGRNGEGKTTFVSQLIAHSLFKEVPVFLYSGEMSDFKIQDWLYKQIVGKKKQYLILKQGKYKVKTELSAVAVQAIKKWHARRLFIYDRSFQGTDFFEIVEVAIDKYGVRLVVIDNLMTVLTENAESLLSDQANFVQKCKMLAIKKNIHVILLTHPNKSKSEIENAEKGNLEKIDISGTNNIPNKADNIITVERLWSERRLCDAIITSHKDREEGQRLQMHMNFSKETLRFNNDRTPETFDYGWEEYL